MEQKTEASQAVDDLHNRLDRIHMACCRPDRPKQAVGEMIHAMLNMSEWNRIRASLKAQPAPTEAAQGMTNAERVQAMNPFKFVPWSKEAEMIEGWTKAEKERNEAQGEDSARLDAADLATIEEATKVLESGAKHNLSMGRTVFAHVQADRASRLRAVLDRARASAETGGVKS